MADTRILGPVLIALLASSSDLSAQGEFVNFETGPVRPLTVARVDGHDYLLVCNTPDNSVEVYDTVSDGFIVRVPVGLRPRGSGPPRPGGVGRDLRAGPGQAD